MIVIPLDNYSAYGTRAHPSIEVETDDSGCVGVTVTSEDADSESTFRSLTPADARALASALIHYAAECGR